MPKSITLGQAVLWARACGTRLFLAARVQRAMEERHIREPHFYVRIIGVRAALHRDAASGRRSCSRRSSKPTRPVSRHTSRPAPSAAPCCTSASVSTTWRCSNCPTVDRKPGPCVDLQPDPFSPENPATAQAPVAPAQRIPGSTAPQIAAPWSRATQPAAHRTGMPKLNTRFTDNTCVHGEKTASLQCNSCIWRLRCRSRPRGATTQARLPSAPSFRPLGGRSHTLARAAGSEQVWTRDSTEAGLGPRDGFAVLVLANLETRPVVGDPAAVDDQLGFPLWQELGCEPGAGDAAATAHADRLTRASQQAPGAVALVTEQTPG